MSELPVERLRYRQATLSNCSVDYFEPFYATVLRSSQIRCAFLFTFLTVGAIHIEVVTGTSLNIFDRGVGVGLSHSKNFIIKELKSARETGELETEGKNPEIPPFPRIFESHFDLPNHYSNKFAVTDNGFILTERTCAIAISADISFKTALAAKFKREYKIIEFLSKQRPGVGGMIALPRVASQIPGKKLCFLIIKATDVRHVNPES